MPEYNVFGIDYDATDLQRDIALYAGIDLNKLRILEDAKRKGLLSANTSQFTEEKVRFLKQHYGWEYLKVGKGDSIRIEDCKPERIHAVITKELRKLLSSEVGQLEITVSEVEAARKRTAEYSRLDFEALKGEREKARSALETFKAEHPEKYRTNVLEALRNQGKE